MNSLLLAWKNIWFRKLESGISIILFAFGVVLALVIYKMNQQITAKFENNLADIDMVVGAKGSPLQMVLCNMYHIDAPTGNISIDESKAFFNPDHPLIKTAIPLSLGDNYQNYRIVGTNLQFLDLYGLHIAQGELPTKTQHVLIGKTVAKELHLKVGDTFFSGHGLQHDDAHTHDDGAPFQVSGILEESNSVADQLIIASTASIWAVHEHHDEEDGHHDHHHDHAHSDNLSDFDLLHFPEKEITSILIQFKNRSFQTLNFLRNINENTNLMAASPAIEINRIFYLLGFGLDAFKMLAMAIIAVTFISVLLSLLNSLKSRVKELALQRMTGASRLFLFNQIVLEGVLLGWIGAILGIVLEKLVFRFGILQFLKKFKYEFDFFGFGWPELTAVGLCMLVGFLSAIYPALKSYYLNISDILKK